MKDTGIYIIRSLVKPNRCYIGSAVSIKQRKSVHLCLLRQNKHHCKKLQNHYNKYGEKDLKFISIVGCDKDKLIEYEQFYIDSYAPWFNSAQHAGNTIGIIPWNKGRKGVYSEETILKMRIKAKSRPQMSDEQKIKLRIANLGKKTPIEVRLKISRSHKGLNTWAKGRDPWIKGKKHTEEARKKMKEKRKLQTFSDETKIRLSIAQQKRRERERILRSK